MLNGLGIDNVDFINHTQNSGISKFFIRSFLCLLIVSFTWTVAAQDQPLEQRKHHIENLPSLNNRYDSREAIESKVKSSPIRVLRNKLWQLDSYAGISVPIGFTPYPTFGIPWPMPKLWYPSEIFYPVNVKHFRILLTSTENHILQNAVHRYTDLISSNKGLSVYPSNLRHREDELSKLASHYLSRRYRKDQRLMNSPQADKFFEKFKSYERRDKMNPLSQAVLLVESPGRSWPSLEMDESYTISASVNGIFILAKETWGALRALETLSELLWTTSDGLQVFINKTYVEDSPRYKHRGLLIDTSRHYISKSTLLVNLEAMAYNKLNVFHWHIVDDHSFPYQSHKYPELSDKGAYRSDMIYSPDDIREILEFARLRGIRVIPEFDMPGHTFSLSLSHPEVLSKCYDSRGWTGHFGPINPVAEETYQFLEGLLGEVSSLFKDAYVHVGGDEVETVCWESNENINMARQQLKLENIGALIDYFWRRIQNIFTVIGRENPSGKRKIIVWEDVLEHTTDMKNYTLIQVWRSSPTQILSQGYNIIYSSCWYLDQFKQDDKWTDYYLCDPEQEAPRGTSQNIIGGEACMWAEFVNDFVISTRIWPLTSAVAERLWSPKQVNNLVDMGPRWEEQRCRLASRGIPVGVIMGPSYCDTIEPFNSNDQSVGYMKNLMFAPSAHVRHTESALYLVLGVIVGIAITSTLFYQSLFVNKLVRQIPRKILLVLVVLVLVYISFSML